MLTLLFIWLGQHIGGLSVGAAQCLASIKGCCWGCEGRGTILRATVLQTYGRVRRISALWHASWFPRGCILSAILNALLLLTYATGHARSTHLAWLHIVLRITSSSSYFITRRSKSTIATTVTLAKTTISRRVGSAGILSILLILRWGW